MFVVIGNIAYDMRDVVEQRHDGGYRILSHSETPGGRAYLQAICLARLGKRVKIIGGVGDDPYGARIRSSLEFEKVSVDLLLTVENSATDIIRIQQDGLHPTYFAQIGASYVLTPGDLKSSYQSIANATAVLVTLGMKFDTLKQALHTVGKKRTIVILRCAPINDDLDIEQISTLLEYIDLLVVSWREVAALSGVDDPDKHTDVDLLEILTKQYNNFSVNIAVHGRDGSTYIIWEKVVYKAAVFPLDIVDVGGMLDAFCSAFASEYHQHNFLSALRYAQAAASYSAHIAGAAASMPTQENIRWVLNKFPSFECVTEIKKGLAQRRDLVIPLFQETAVPVKERWHVYLVPHKDKFTFYKNNDIKYEGDPLTSVQMRDLSLTFILAKQVVEFDSLAQKFSLSELKNQLHAEDKIVLGDVQTQILKMLGKELQ